VNRSPYGGRHVLPVGAGVERNDAIGHVGDRARHDGLPCSGELPGVLIGRALKVNRLIRNGRAPRSLARDDGLHDLRGAIADVKTEQIAQALLEGQRAVVSAMAMHEKT
jgi:hypothetical protein